MAADTLWAFCLGLNVFLTFNSHKFTVHLRKLEVFYCVACYGIPFFPALIYLVLDTRYGHEIYGDATVCQFCLLSFHVANQTQIWCWVTEEHKWLRLGLFYAPVWVVILATMLMYAVVGKNIWMNRVNNSYVQQQLDTGNTGDTDGTFSSLQKGKLSRGLGSIVHTKEVSVETRPYTPAQEAASIVTGNDSNDNTNESRQVTRQASFSALHGQVVGAPSAPQPQQVNQPTPGQSASRQVSIAPPQSPHPGGPSRNTYTTSISGTMSPMNTSAMRGARTYARVAILIFVVAIIVWVPSSVNRLYTFVHPPKFGLNVAAAAVLPLQGFFNCVIYCFTSRQQLRTIWRGLKAEMRKLPYTNAMMRGALGSRSFPAEMDGGEGQVPLRERRNDAQRRLHELDDLDSRYDVDEESRIASPSGSPEEVSPVNVDAPALPVAAAVSSPEEPQSVVFPTNGRVCSPPLPHEASSSALSDMRGWLAKGTVRTKSSIGTFGTY